MTSQVKHDITLMSETHLFRSQYRFKISFQWINWKQTLIYITKKVYTPKTC
jgi:hypothetical protein